MALRIGSKFTRPKPPEFRSEDEATEAADTIDKMPEATDVEPIGDDAAQGEDMTSEGRVSPDVARYFGPEAICSGCVHFIEPGSCEIVAGPIDPGGRCSLWTSDDAEEKAESPDEESSEDLASSAKKVL